MFSGSCERLSAVNGVKFGRERRRRNGMVEYSLSLCSYGHLVAKDMITTTSRCSQVGGGLLGISMILLSMYRNKNGKNENERLKMSTGWFYTHNFYKLQFVLQDHHITSNVTFTHMSSPQHIQILSNLYCASQLWLKAALTNHETEQHSNQPTNSFRSS